MATPMTGKWQDAEAEFQHNLSALVSKQLCGDAETIGALIERLTDALGLAVAVSCGGNIAQADEIMTGVEGYLAECVANHAKLAAFMAECRKARPSDPPQHTGKG